MKKIYAILTLLLVVVTVNLNAQFIELDTEPVFWLQFDEAADQLPAAGSQAFGGFEMFGGETVEADTVKGHAWGGGTHANWTFLEQIVSSDVLPEVFIPTMFWDSYAAIERPQGIAAYTNVSGGYLGPIGTSGRTISMYVYYTDSARVDTANGAWAGPHMLFDVGKWDQEGGGGMTRWMIEPTTMKMEFDWGLSKDFTAEGVFEKEEWVHLGLTIPEGGARADIKLYVNGQIVDFVAEESWNNPDLAEPVTTLNTVGAAGWDGIRIGRLANVWMADYRVYDVELSQKDMLMMADLPTSAQKFDNEELFNVYPVPNDGVFKVELAQASAKNLTIRNTIGQVVYNQNVEQSEIVNVKHLNAGMYFITVSDKENNSQTRKIMIR